MKQRMLSLAVAATLAAAGTPMASADGGKSSFSTNLVGYQETPVTINSPGSGEFAAKISKDGSEIQYVLSYRGLTTNVLQSHIHFGQKAVTGPISVFLCTNLGNGPAGTQPCPAPPATISGTITAVDVTNLANERGISAGEFDELLKAIRAGATYVNVHSTRWPGGEIRSQINGNSGDEKH